ncbi:putative cytochrome P450 [Lachnellula willkommii]|uniref:Putative cytochrome P450 n=1 Tax=Lachnellula willkommii TaxID=215461 RepID=A0A559M4Q4_9HELO|nr:putative cytochrome P450 [Lachnellula willkommii]
MTWFGTTALCVALIFAGFAFVYPRPIFRRKACGAPKYIRDSDQAKDLLANSTLKSRAKPNERLVRAFGINNAFTATVQADHRDFVNYAKQLIRMQEHDWKSLGKTAVDGASRIAGTVQTSGLTSLETSVQLLVFHIVMGKFFPHVQPAPSDTDVEYIATTINDLWVASKCSKNKQLLLDKKNIFLGRLETILDRNNVGKNPLNIILPAYETLWRVVLRCFLEIRFRSSNHDRRAWTKLLSDFLSDPTQANFAARLRDQVSIKDITLEALRLYPPTRRIYRDQGGILIAIDIEYMHRDHEIWGPDADTFNPSRIEDMTSGIEDMKRQAFMPFGKGSFACPAENVFGPMMIGILVGALVTEVNNSFKLVDDKGEEIDLGEGPLDNGREAYGGLCLRCM